MIQNIVYMLIKMLMTIGIILFIIIAWEFLSKPKTPRK